MTVAFVTAAIACALALAAQGQANPAPIHIAKTSGEGVYIRPEPNTSQPAVGWMPEGASPDYHCFVWSQVIGGVPIWFNVTYNGVTGYYASYYDDSSYQSNDELTAKYGVPLCGSAPPAPAPDPAAPPPPPATSPSAPGGLVFPVFNADGGVYYRTAPDWEKPDRRPGVGVYNGDQVELVCGSLGDAVGPYNNKAWSKVRNLSRPSIGEGWVNEHFINDGAPANGFVTGEPMCGSSSTAPMPTSVFYSGTDVKTGLSDVTSLATTNLKESDWSSGSCSSSKILDVTPDGVSTLAGWSNGRLGPIYFLSAAKEQRSAQVHTIILFDPGRSDEFEKASPTKIFKDTVRGRDSSTCDWKYPVGQLLADWLESDNSNRLMVLTGIVSEEKDGDGKSTYSGLWHFYFPKIWNQSFASRAQVCDYDKMSHEDVLRKFAGIVKSLPSGCPPAPKGFKRTQWHP